jgi:hypothetical protein
MSQRIVTVKRWRDDGWPICPLCDEDELAAIAATIATPEAVDLCYVCGPVKLANPNDPRRGQA